MLWENLKAKLPMDAKYTEAPEIIDLAIKITGMNISYEEVEFTLTDSEGSTTISCNRRDLTMRAAKEGLLIEAPNLWSILLPTGQEPPPRDACCDCCGRSVKELKPFGKAGDPLVGDFDGALLVKMFRSMECLDIEPLRDKDGRVLNPYEKEDEKIAYERYGKEHMEGYYLAEQLNDTVESSWECRDCILLDGKEFYDKRNEVRNKHASH
jgi:hypothetical protein